MNRTQNRYCETRLVQPPYTAKQVGTPGSPLAVHHGCTCAVLDNHQGRGFGYGNEGSQKFWISEGCPLHAPTPENDPED